MTSPFIEVCRRNGIDFALGNAGKLKVNADKSALTAEMVSKIKAAKSQIIACLKAEQLARLADDFQARITNRNEILAKLNLTEQDIEGFYPLVPLQQGMLLQHMLCENNDTYIKYFILKVDDEQALNDVLAGFDWVNLRHASCRTQIIWRGVEQAYQLVKKQVELPVTYIDCDDEADFEAKLQALKSADRMMDLEQDPLMRIQVLQRADSQEKVLFIEKHHIVSDSMSLEITLFELLAHYRKTQDQLPAAKHQYEFALQLNAQGQSDNGYFDELLKDFETPSLLFKINQTHVHPDNIEECVYEHEINASVQQGIREQAKNIGASPSIIFHYAWAMVMAKFCDSKDVLFPTVMTGRMMVPEYRTTIGMFLNSLPLRVKLDERSIADQLTELNMQMVQAYRYEQIPLDSAIQKLSDEFGTVFNCIFNYRHMEEERLLDELPFEPLIAKDKSSTPFFISVTETRDAFKIDLDIYKGTNGIALIHALELALAHIVNTLATEPKAPFMMPSLLPQAEVQELVVGLNNTEMDYPKDLCFHQLFEQHALANPQNTALVFEDQQLSYQALNEKANQLAHYLVQNHDIKPNTMVGLCVERSMEMVIGILAIVKAGGCYVPFDIEHGTQIINARIASHNVSTILCSNETQSLLESDSLVQLNINRLLHDGCESYSKANIETTFSAETLAYAMSSSGTTGKPKLIGLPHRALTNLITSMRNDNAAVDGVHKVLQFSSVGFDMSFADMALSLLQGGSLYLISESNRFDVKRLAQIINEQQISMLFLPASIVTVLAEVCVECEIALPSVKMMISTAEKLEVSDKLKTFFNNNKHIRLANHFGPTETHVCTTYNFAASTDEWPSEVPIGKPIGNTQCYILNANHTLTPKGQVGELYVGGDCLAAGYIGNDALTAEKFIEKDWDNLGNVKLYRTGDLVKWENGQLIYIGRADDQLKINGYRVELNDVKQQILLHPKVNNATVIHEKKLDHLIGYFSGEGIEESELRTYLLKNMAQYMVPKFLVKVDGFKLNVNGKIDKSALPTLDAVYSQQEYVAPETEMEEVLIARIAQLIGIDGKQLSTSESFLNLGGNSILSVKLSQGLAAQFDIEPPLVLIMESNSIKELALELDLIVSIQNDAPLEHAEELVEEEW